LGCFILFVVSFNASVLFAKKKNVSRYICISEEYYGSERVVFYFRNTTYVADGLVVLIKGVEPDASDQLGVHQTTDACQSNLTRPTSRINHIGRLSLSLTRLIPLSCSTPPTTAPTRRPPLPRRRSPARPHPRDYLPEAASPRRHPGSPKALAAHLPVLRLWQIFSFSHLPPVV
jgi:hypothetical protein